MRRIGSVIKLAVGAQEEYEALHRSVWPDVLAQIRRSNIQNYSIYRYGDLLFSYFEYVGTNFEGDMSAMGEDARTKEWWTLTIPLQSPMPERQAGEWWMELPELFHMD